MNRFCRIFCLLAALVSSGFAAVKVVVSGGVLRDASGSALPTGSMVALVASTQDDVFSSPVPLSPFQVGTIFGGDDVVLALFSVDAVSTAINGGSLGITSLDYAAMGIPNLGAGDRVALYWFPPASVSNGQILSNAPYGRSGTTWLAPDDSTGGVVEFNFLTAAIGGAVNDSLAFAALTVGSGAGTLQFAQASSQVGENAVTTSISVTRVGGSSGAVSVQYATANGSAIAPGDYANVSGTLNWADGDTATKQIPVSIVNDGTAESSESFTVVLSTPTGAATLGNPNTTTVTIVDDDSSPPINVAAAANGGTATASSFYNAGYAPSGAIDGNRRGDAWGSGGGWNDSNSGQWPDWLQITFAAAKTIYEVNVFTVQDAFASPVDPTVSLPFTLYGLTDFEVQYWTGSQWLAVPGGIISGNTLVWRKITFSPLTTTAIRIHVTGALNGFSRITEVEAYSAP